MPKMTINVDTDAKSFSVSLNGAELSNIHGVEIYKSWDEDENEYYIHLRTCVEVDGVKTATTYMLECEKASASAESKAPKIDGFVAQKALSPLQSQIQEWLKNG
jgi:hypothetical protein